MNTSKFTSGTSSTNFSYTVKHVISETNKSEVFCMRYSPDDTFLLVGCSDGSLNVYSAANGRQFYNWNTAPKVEIKLPVTSLCFRPEVTLTKNKNIAICANGNTIQHWHITSGRSLHITKEENHVYALAYRPDALYFASAGKDATIRLYDESTKSLVTKMSGGNGLTTAGHANRIFTVKFHPTDPNLLLSGGWDNTVQIWDKRSDVAVRRIFGPHICGDSLDIDHQNTVLTGSWRPTNQIQLWDFSTGKLIEDIKYPSTSANKQQCNVYTCQFNPTYSLIAAGGGGACEGKILERNTGKLCGAITGLEKAIFSMTFSNDSQQCAAAGGDGCIYILGSKNKPK